MPPTHEQITARLKTKAQPAKPTGLFTAENIQAASSAAAGVGSNIAKGIFGFVGDQFSKVGDVFTGKIKASPQDYIEGTKKTFSGIFSAIDTVAKGINKGAVVFPKSITEQVAGKEKANQIFSSPGLREFIKDTTGEDPGDIGTLQDYGNTAKTGAKDLGGTELEQRLAQVLGIGVGAFVENPVLGPGKKTVVTKAVNEFVEQYGKQLAKNTDAEALQIFVRDAIPGASDEFYTKISERIAGARTSKQVGAVLKDELGQTFKNQLDEGSAAARTSGGSSAVDSTRAANKSLPVNVSETLRNAADDLSKISTDSLPSTVKSLKISPVSSKNLTSEDLSSMRKLYDNLNQKASDFKTLLKETGVKNPVFNVKTAKSALEKVSRKRAYKSYSPSELTDFVRGAGQVNTPADAAKIVARLGDRVTEVNDFFQKPNAWGYTGMNINVKLADGTIAELQLHTPASQRAQEAIHKLYEKYRDTPVGEIPASVLEESNRIAGEVYKKSGGFPPKGTGPAKKAAAGDKKGRTPRFAEAVRTSPEIAREVQREVSKAPYERITNQEIVETAKNAVAADPDAAARAVLTSTKPSAQDTATGIELIRHYQGKKDYKAAAEIADTLADKLVKNGQTIQAAKLLERLSPEGVLSHAQKIIRDINHELKLKGKETIQLGDEFADKITDLAKARDAATDPLLKEEISWEIGSMLASLKRATIGEKVSMAQTILQLLNPKTLLTRNPLGNELFYRTERLSRMIAAPIDWTKSTLTGRDRVVVFLPNRPLQGRYWKDWMRGVRAGWKGVTPGMLPTQLDVGRQVFKSKKNPFYWGEKLLGAGLRGFDFAAYSRAKQQTIGELSYTRALSEGLSGDEAITAAKKYMTQVDDHIEQIADKYGRYITFQDDNMISMGFSKLKKGLNLGQKFGLGDLALKYPRTPGALLMRAIEYSPAGFLRSAYIVAKPFLKGGKVDEREAMQALSRAITGTLGFTGLGYFLADKGIITGAPDDDNEVSALERSVGAGQYRVNISALGRWIGSGFNEDSTERKDGDIMYSYDWAQPIAVSVSIGANMNESIDNGKLEAAGLATTALKSLEGGVNTLVEQPLVRGITRLFGFGDVLGGIEETLKGLPSSFIPTLSNQINQWIDNTKHNPYDPSILAQSLNLAKMKVPGFAQGLHPAVDQFGRTAQVYQGNSNNIFNVFFNPGFQTQFATTPEARLVLDVLENTGDTGVAPRIAPKSINGEPLTADQYEEYQRFIGTKTAEAFASFASSDDFMALLDEDKAELMGQTLSEIGKAAKAEVLGGGTGASGVNWEDRLTFLEVQALAKAGNMDAAEEIVNSLSDDEYEAYKSVRSSARAKNTKKLRDMLRMNAADGVLFLREQTPEEQQRLLNVMTDEEYALYERGKSGTPTPESQDTTPDFEDGDETSQHDIVDTVLTYAQALGTDPLTAFDRIFSGQRILRLDNGAIIVERMPLDASQRVKRDRGAGTEMKLDHTIPLQLGGSNGEDNLKLVPADVWESYTPVENYLGKQLKAGKITKKEAQERIQKFKDGEITAAEAMK